MSRWFRMYDDVINDPKVMRLQPATRWHWVALLCVASKHGGKLPPVADLAFVLRMSEDEAGAILWDLNAAGLVDEIEPGIYAPHNWDGRQHKSDVSTGRVKAFRERQRNAIGNVSCNDERNVSGNSDATSGAVTETAPEQKQIQKQKEDSRSVADRPARVPSRFDDFWQAYPSREGPNPRKPAEQRFDALVKTGIDPEFLIAEAKKLHATESARGNIGTRFIPQAVTWLNQQRWSDHAAVAAALALGSSPEMPIEDAVRLFAKIGRWSRHAGPEPGHANCRASPELLARYGFGPSGEKLSTVAA